MKKHLFNSNFTSYILATLFICVFSVLAQEGFYLDGVIPDRDPTTSPYLVDLSDYYTAPLDNDWLVSIGVNLQNLPKGLQTFLGVEFDVRGIVQVAGTQLLIESILTEQQKAEQYPQSIEGIVIGLKAEKLYFLQASAWGAGYNQQVGEYVVHYSNGQEQSIPILYQHSVIDWWCSATAKPSDAEIAWHGSHDKSEISLFLYTWENPSPDVTIDELDFVSAMTSAAPFMIALTCQPLATRVPDRISLTPCHSKNDVTVQVFDIRGRVVQTITGAGNRQNTIRDQNASSGLYLMRFISKDKAVAKPVVITR